MIFEMNKKYDKKNDEEAKYYEPISLFQTVRGAGSYYKMLSGQGWAVVVVEDEPLLSEPALGVGAGVVAALVVGVAKIPPRAEETSPATDLAAPPTAEVTWPTAEVATPTPAERTLDGPDAVPLRALRALAAPGTNCSSIVTPF